MIPIYKPFLPKNSLRYAHEALDSGWISSQGEYLEFTKNELKKRFGFNKVILTNNGTTATHLISISIKEKFPHITKILVPNNVYVAAWNSFLYDKNFELIPIDSNLLTWNFDETKISKLLDEKTAILVVHNVGNIINVPKLKRQFPETIIIEDNCEGFLGKYENKYTGSESIMSSISFFGNKTLTSGEGGAFITNSDEIFEYANIIKNQGQSEIKFVHDFLGYNYRMTNIQAAILYGQLEIMDTIVENKKKIFEEYENQLKETNEISFQKIEDGTIHSNWMKGIRFNNFTISDKKNLELFLFESGIDTRPMFYTIDKHKYLSNIKSESSNSNVLQSQCLILPSYPELTLGQVSYICDKINKFLKTYKK